MSKRWVACGVVATVAAVIVTFASVAGGGANKSGGTFRYGTGSGIDSLNPYVAFNQDAYSTFEYVYPVLVQYDKNLHFVPFFARSWKASNGGKTWTFKTVPNAKWTDGKPLTAADAAWTINTDLKYQSSGAANVAGLVSHIKGASAPNPTTLVVRYTQRPNPSYVLGQFQQFYILPKHIWSKHTGHKGADLKRFANSAPVGSGPFKIVKYQKNEITLMERNDSYWGKKPQVKEFGLRQFSSDDAMISALKAHEIDAIGAVPATAISTLKKAGFSISDVRGLDQTDFIINSNPKKKKHRELLNPKVKEAFAHAVDRAQIIRVVFLGTAQPASSIVPAPSGGGWHNPQLKPEAFDLARANRILDKLGYKKGSGGIRVANGHKMSYDVISPTSVSSASRTFQILQPDFKKIGVQLRQKSLDATAAFDLMAGSNYTYQGFDLALWDWTSLIDPDFMLSVVTCAQWGGWSDSGFCDKRYDKMYAQQQLAPTDAARRALVWKMQAYLYNRRPYIWLANDDSVSAVSKSWAGFENTPQGPFNELSIATLTSVHQK